MIDRAASFITGEGNWLPLAMGIALAVTALQGARHARYGARDRVMEAMNMFVGVTLTVMGIGHLLAVSIHVMEGSLRGSAALLYAIGAAILVPATLIALNATRKSAESFNAWMAVTLFVLGLVNIPLAIPALLNIAYSRHRQPLTGRIILGAWLLVTVGLFAGGMMFMLSGARTFEEFGAMG